jgi:YtxH-like protein
LNDLSINPSSARLARLMLKRMNVRLEFLDQRYLPKEVAMSSEGKQVARWAALVAGSAAVGAGIGLLLAPQTGTETRREIARYAKKAQLQATRLSRAVQSGVKEAMDRTKRPMVEAV